MHTHHAPSIIEGGEIKLSQFDVESAEHFENKNLDFQFRIILIVSHCWAKNALRRPVPLNT